MIIQCPLCKKDLDLVPGIAGRLNCPLCGGAFQVGGPAAIAAPRAQQFSLTDQETDAVDMVDKRALRASRASPPSNGLIAVGVVAVGLLIVIVAVLIYREVGESERKRTQDDTVEADRLELSVLNLQERALFRERDNLEAKSIFSGPENKRIDDNLRQISMRRGAILARHPTWERDK